MDDFDIDPEMAAAMGFSAFGQPANKKRKYDNQGFVDPDITAPQGTSANNVPVGERKITNKPAEAPAQPAPETDSDGKPTLQALSKGIRNARGDVVVFLPSFIEDPWAGLRGK